MRLLIYYEYTVKDHLGNARISFRANGTAISILQENHYYPFGLDMEGSWQAQVGTKNGYLYNSKELNEDFGLNWYDYGARWYDAAVGRWWSVDPLGEKSQNISAFVYVGNNPLTFIDPNGMESEAITGLSGLAAEERENTRDDKIIRSIFQSLSSGGWYKDTDNMIMFGGGVNSQKDLKDGQIYLGSSYTERDGSSSTYYTQGGGIFFQSFKKAINYMDKLSPKIHKEILGFIFDDGIITSPYQDNEVDDSSLKNGWGIEVKNGESFLTTPAYNHGLPIIGSVHTHNAEFSGGTITKVSGPDIRTYTKVTPDKPFFVIENDGIIYGGIGNRNGSQTKTNQYGIIWRETTPFSVNDILNGKKSIQKIAKNEKM